jgi:hypothetical protein
MAGYYDCFSWVHHGDVEGSRVPEKGNEQSDNTWLVLLILPSVPLRAYPSTSILNNHTPGKSIQHKTTKEIGNKQP